MLTLQLPHMPDELRSAYAVLGLRPGASLHRVKRQFKTMVRRWHPDRFANDPQGKAEANDRLRVINIAYSTILQTSFGETILQARRDPSAYARPAPDGATAGQGPYARAEPGRASAPDPTPPRPVAPLTREQIDALIDALRGHRRRKPVREQIRDDPWNRGLSLAVVGVYVLSDAWQTWRHPWPRLALRGIRPTWPATGPVLAAVVGSVLWTLPLLWVIWYADAFSKRVAWVFLALFAAFLPFFAAMMEL